ncbi:hypothetical protein FAVG1_00885 [Fusarium avenaceum]|nr:hypothetical protein FAVG1_00885 [Fusarium avenaceum]
MGSFTFKWEHPADEVYVTGTFDNWTKSVQLEKKGDVFSKTVDLKEPEGKIYYKLPPIFPISRNIHSALGIGGKLPVIVLPLSPAPEWRSFSALQSHIRMAGGNIVTNPNVFATAVAQPSWICQDRGLSPWFISLSVMSWVLCDPSASRAVPNQRPPRFVSGERWKICFTQPISGRFPGHANEILWRQATIWRRADPKSPRAAKASSSQRLICLRASFIVDGNWIINQSAPNEPDLEGNVNNFVTPDQLTSKSATAAILNTVTPTSTTAAMASEQPIENKATEPKTFEDKSGHDEKLPLETPSDIPGGFPITPANELDKVFGVNPLPASEGAGNPIKLEAGEKIPESITTQSTDKYVKLDKESYEKSDALPGIETDMPPVLPNTIPESGLPIIGPDVTLNSVAPTATTAGLAAAVPLESNGAFVPEVVRESQEKAGAVTEASTDPTEVKEKTMVEEELKGTIPEAPATSVGTAGVGTEKSENTPDTSLAALAATAGGAVIAAGLAAKETVEEKAVPALNSAADAITDTANKNLPDSVKEQLPIAAQQTLAAKNEEQIRQEVSPEVPVEVKESLIEAGKAPEAAANTAAVEDKKEMEAELLKEVKPITGIYDSVVEQPKEEPKEVSPEVPVEVKDSIAEAGKSPEAAANTQAVEEKKLVEAELLKEVKPAATIDETPQVAPEVPTEVKESIVEAGERPEAAANAEAVENKKEMEAQLLKEAQPVPAADEAKPEPIVEPKETKVQESESVIPAVAPTETKAEETKPVAVPVTKTEAPKTEEAKPVAKTETPAVGNGTSTTGNGTSAPGNGAKAAGASANGSSPAASGKEKKKNRLSSIFSKIKSKLSDK